MNNKKAVIVYYLFGIVTELNNSAIGKKFIDLNKAQQH